MFFILLTMAHHDRCISERVIALAEKKGLSDNEWNQWSKQKGFGLLIKEVNFWKQPFLRAKVLLFIFYELVRYFAGPSGWAVYGPLPAEIVGSNPTGGKDVSPLWVVCVPKATARIMNGRVVLL